MAIDLNKIGDKVKALYEKRKTDIEIAETLDIPVSHTKTIRCMLGLGVLGRLSAFMKARKLLWNTYSEKFNFTLSIPHDKADELGLIVGKDYEYFASVEKKGVISIQISQKV